MDKWYFVNRIFDDFVGGFLFYIILVHILKRVAFSIQRFYRKNSRFSYFLFFWKENITLWWRIQLLGIFFSKIEKKRKKNTFFFFIQLKICWNKIKIRKFTYSIKVFIRVFYMFYFLLNLKCNKKITFFFLFFYRFYTYFGYIGSRIKTTLLVNRMCTRSSCCSNAFVRSGKITFFIFNVVTLRIEYKREIYYTWVNSTVLRIFFFLYFQMEYFILFYVL